jgi:hypothetical protein
LLSNFSREEISPKCLLYLAIANYLLLQQSKVRLMLVKVICNFIN